VWETQEAEEGTGCKEQLLIGEGRPAFEEVAFKDHGLLKGLLSRAFKKATSTELRTELSF